MWTFLKDHFWEIALGANYLLSIAAAITVLFSNYNPTKTLSYLVALLAFPFLGLLIYVMFGRDYRNQKIFKRKKILDQEIIKKWQRSDRYRQFSIDDLDDEGFQDKLKVVRLLQRGDRSLLTAANKVDLLINGEEKFERLFQDIAQAREHIHLEYYIFRDDEIGKELISRLCEKALSGVNVRINYDYVGSSLSSQTKSLLKDSGVQFYPFMPVYFPRFASKMNYRNHRKMVIIDGEIGYVGGINVGDEYVNQPGKRYWRDTHLRIEGPAARMLQLHFVLNWDFVTSGDVTVEDPWFPDIPGTGTIPVQIAASGPDSDWASILEVIFMAINAADQYVYITTPYFIPNDELIMALRTAARSGVTIRIIIPRISDSWYAKYASYSYLSELMEAGVEVYRYTKGIIHSKTMVIDGLFSTVGTANLDYRSFSVNFEINALMYDRDFASKMVKVFESDLALSERVDPQLWEKRGNGQRVKEAFCRLGAPLL